jgi:hypothetical protein
MLIKLVVSVGCTPPPLLRPLLPVQDKYYDIIQEKDGRKLMQLMAPIWRLATYITQHMGWNCKEIRKLGLNIDYEDDLDKTIKLSRTQVIHSYWYINVKNFSAC